MLIYFRLKLIRMISRQNFDSQNRELTAISRQIVSVLSTGQFTDKILGDVRVIDNIESSNTIREDPNIAPPATDQRYQRCTLVRGNNRATLRLRLPSSFINTVWEFAINEGNQAWKFSFRSYNIRPWNTQIFHAIREADLPQVYDLLNSGRASIWDRDPSGRGVLHYAAEGCSEHGSSVVEYLVRSGADIYSFDDKGFPPLFSFEQGNLHVPDKVKESRLVAGYKAFRSHRDWIPSDPSLKVAFENCEASSDIVEKFPIYRNPPQEIIHSVLHDIWPPWNDMLPADRMKCLFPRLNVTTLSGFTSPLSMRVCLGREYIQKTFANWNTEDKIELISYSYDVLAEQSVLGSEKGVQEARLFLKDMHITNSLIDILPEADPLRCFLHRWASEEVPRFRWEVEKYTNAAHRGLKRYISEMMLLGIDIATVIEIEKKVLARQDEQSGLRAIWKRGMPFKIIAIEYSLKADNCHVWLSSPLDEWAGEFWDMIEHPERTMPGTWGEEF